MIRGGEGGGERGSVNGGLWGSGAQQRWWCKREIKRKRAIRETGM